MRRVFVVEPYFSGSHEAWAEGYRRHSTHETHLLTLPGRFWKWRMFGGSLTLAREASALAGEVGQPDVLLVSDMLDLPSFLGHAGASLGNPGVVLYMHENQLTYPLSPTARDDLAYAYMNWSSMVRADAVWFNSRFHQDALFAALSGFLRHFPDHRHSRLVDPVREKTSVMPVGVDLDWISEHRKTEPPLVAWNQRWEYDKDPIRLFAALYRLADAGAEFRLALCGENFRNVPAEFEEAKDRLSEYLIHYGHADRATYETLLLDSSVIVSTAKHEFFGVGAVEGMAAGALPVFPNDLSYPEIVPLDAHPATLYESDAEFDSLLARAVGDSSWRSRTSDRIAPTMERFAWTTVAPAYDEALSG